MARKKVEVEEVDNQQKVEPIKAETPAIEMAKRLRLAGVKRAEGEQIIGLLQKLGGRIMVQQVSGLTGHIGTKVMCAGFTFIQDIE